ncbi:uncharacterized protein C3orf38 homolog [Electrophorus electricus]|uniref:uncharacterized protein C3orf38 homolog n=1 Tax=Electrophorus electricus TaxID=8005 RepID=UPI0015CFDEA3|nr:uncharacterized protein C3orf38 homolog [Electrophorus electricus]XP_035379683.1 uncharacterized protein C3orf38 homolog [Electrophorus electricus]XP_035379684.1 uncharacterized protein C3orf38 homolog [Electrophorus electricus]
MSALSQLELNGCRKLLKLLPADDLLTLKDTVTNRMIAVESSREAIEAIITYSQNSEELLKRKKVHRDIIFKYLTIEGVVVPPNSEKQQLVKRTLELWSSGNNSVNDNNPGHSDKSGDGLADLTELGKQFCQWYFHIFNSQNPMADQPAKEWGPQHFWKDVRLLILSYTGEQQKEEFHGAELVCQRLLALVEEERLVFCPNLAHPGMQCFSTPHGLVLVAVAGTIHRDTTCLGIFEQVFGLIRAPMDGNSWKIKSLHLKIKGQISREKLPEVTYDVNEMLQLLM